MVYLILEEKKKLSLIINSLLFSAMIASLKNSSLEAKKGLILKLFALLNVFNACLL